MNCIFFNLKMILNFIENHYIKKQSTHSFSSFVTRIILIANLSLDTTIRCTIQNREEFTVQNNLVATKYVNNIFGLFNMFAYSATNKVLDIKDKIKFCNFYFNLGKNFNL